jgi:hypothetical protein
MKPCECDSNINRDGSGQKGRFLRALDPDYAPIDGRSLEDLLVFAKRYADQIRFYDIPGSVIPDSPKPGKVSWREFFRRDMAVIASSLATLNTEIIRKNYDEIRQHLEESPAATEYESLFDPIAGMITRMDHWYTVAIPENPLHTDLDTVINSSLLGETKKLLAYAGGYRLEFPKKNIEPDFSKIENPGLWGLQEQVDPITNIYSGNTEEEKLRNAALYVDDIFLRFHESLVQLVASTDKYMQFALEDYPEHQPYMSLFLAFLELFRKAQEQMNGLTGRMLNYYYRDVLQLREKPPVPDRVHVIFELAKEVSTFDLPAGTLLSAGKDLSGKEQVYVTNTDFVINQAKIKELKNLFIEKKLLDKPGQYSLEAFYARPQANSGDGFGSALTDASGKWSTFGNRNSLWHPSANPCEMVNRIIDETNRKDVSSIGFAIASPQLLLQGGKRVVRLKIRAIDRLVMDAEGKQVKSPFEIYFTAAKGWLKISRLMPVKEYELLSKSLQNGVFEPDDGNIDSAYFIEAETQTLFIYLPIPEQPVINFDPEIHKGFDFRTAYPVIRIMLSPLVNLQDKVYNSLRTDDLGLEIKVGSIFPSKNQLIHAATIAPRDRSLFDGLKTITVQNDDGNIDPSKPFDPFTAYPDQGKSFYVGSGEVFNKPLGELAINIRTGRTARIASGKGTLGVSVLKDRNWISLKPEKENEFTEFLLDENILFQVAENGNKAPLPLPRRPVLPVTGWNSNTLKGFVRVTYLPAVSFDEKTSFFQASQELAPWLKISEISVSYHSFLAQLEPGIDQFFHIYPFGVTETYNNPAGRGLLSKTQPAGQKHDFLRLKELRNGLLIDANNLLLPQFSYVNPYSVFEKAKPLPDIKREALAETISGISKKSATANAVFDYPRVLAYGAGLKSDQNALNQYSGREQEEGSLFIGVEKLEPLQNLSMLFQFAEGSAQDEDHDPPPVHWTYLSYNEWKPLKGENLVSDGTFGFQATGIIKISVPADANKDHSVMTDGLHWFCASVTEHAERIPQLVSIITQAVEATFRDKDNDPSHYDNPLTAGSISKLTVTTDEVSKVQQPFASFDGKHREVGNEFYTRASERLRHKKRAINAWDYEHLVLDRFPSIYKVKCIPHTDPNCLCRHAQLRTGRMPKEKVLTVERAESLLEREFINLAGGHSRGSHDENCCGPQVAPGHVLLVPIANFRNRNAVNPLQPKTGKRVLLEIEDYLKGLTSPGVHIHARNPVYEQIIVAFRVKFHEGYDTGYYLKKLNDEIVRFLTPWAFDEEAEVKFGDKVYASLIINFIEERVYVDFITDFFMAVCREECCPREDDRRQPPGNAGVEGPIASAPELHPRELSGVCSCEELLYLIAGHNKFRGEIVAVPSGPRSILVSVPQHIIIPYEEPDSTSPCDERIRAGSN